ncbi:hypothetical protein ANN_26559 [Periplaneta americana]|uniref:Uncharacterized protein n=1 Tax=Periplaneta americana TaxID=6978 RepID=A0ABQ8RYL4_PERAM|nr:hypothetical protein ANN_26559 [Periplaneta americana]
MWRQKFEEIGQNEWANVCRHVEAIEQHYFEKGVITEHTIERILIQDDGLENSDSSEDEMVEIHPGNGNGASAMSRVEELHDD